MTMGCAVTQYSRAEMTGYSQLLLPLMKNGWRKQSYPNRLRDTLTSDFRWPELMEAATPVRLAGSGLGLALAQRIAARHGATITVRSRLEQGTVFTLRLPLPA
jgi:hypothetical protein